MDTFKKVVLLETNKVVTVGNATGYGTYFIYNENKFHINSASRLYHLKEHTFVRPPDAELEGLGSIYDLHLGVIDGPWEPWCL